jgi:hypothetical protein
MASADHDVHVSFKYVRYSEGTDSINFDRDAGGEAPPTVWVPSRTRWETEVPSWAAGRRNVILDRLLRSLPPTDVVQEFD